jgi:hypothetical protein
MSIYATTTSLEILMIGTNFDTATTSLATKLITHSENEINKYLSKRYDISSFNTTSTSVPPIVTTLCETLAEGYMHQRMSRGSKDAIQRSKQLIDQAIENLKLIADYKLDLIDSSGDRITDLSTGAFQILSTTQGYANTFNEDDQLDWKIDSLKLDDIDSERG